MLGTRRKLWNFLRCVDHIAAGSVAPGSAIFFFRTAW